MPGERLGSIVFAETTRDPVVEEAVRSTAGELRRFGPCLVELVNRYEETVRKEYAMNKVLSMINGGRFSFTLYTRVRRYMYASSCGLQVGILLMHKRSGYKALLAHMVPEFAEWLAAREGATRVILIGWRWGCPPGYERLAAKGGWCARNLEPFKPLEGGDS